MKQSVVVVNKGGGNLGTSGSVSFQFRKMGVFRLDPSGIDQDDLELYLMDHGLDEMGESTGEKGEPVLLDVGGRIGLEHPFAKTAFAVCLSRLPVGSSAKTQAGLPTSARATATR